MGHHGGMKIRICFLVIMLAPLAYYGMIQLAPAGKAATVSASFHGLGKTALQKIESAQDAASDTDEVFNARVAEADRALAVANSAVVTPADRRDYTRLVNYLYSVKQDRLLQAASDPNNAGQTQDQEQTDAARAAAERTFQ